MQTRLFYTTGKQDIIECLWDKPEISDNEIEVKSFITGVCRSDIDMYAGTFQLLPKNIQGHESIGIVTKVGKSIKDVREGDYVATRGEPAFADYYNCKAKMYVKIPALEPKYIIEPVACGVNIAESIGILDEDQNILILGSGFLSTIVYSTIDSKHRNPITVVGNANRDFWTDSNARVETLENLKGQKFDYIVDLSDKPEYLDLNLHKEGATIIIGAEKHPAATTTFGNFLWSAVTLKFPSPRNTMFYSCMQYSLAMINRNIINVDNLWTKGYDRETEVKKAFEEGFNRPKGYSRGYIEWQK